MLQTAQTAAMGGKQTFATDANIRSDFRKAGLRFPFWNVGSTNGGYAGLSQLWIYQLLLEYFIFE
jgi:hypothetical protein